MVRALALMALLGACGDDSSPSGPGVLAAMAERGAWMEDYVWGPDSYKACIGCEHLTVLDFQADRYQLHVFMRTPGQPASVTEQCSSTFLVSEEAIPGFAISDRAKMSITIGANTCGYTEGIKATSVFEIVSTDSTGATYVAGWDRPADLTAPFPGYKYDVATGYAYPMKPCATAPATLCEPACNLTPLSDCGLPEP